MPLIPPISEPKKKSLSSVCENSNVKESSTENTKNDKIENARPMTSPLKKPISRDFLRAITTPSKTLAPLMISIITDMNPSPNAKNLKRNAKIKTKISENDRASIDPLRHTPQKFGLEPAYSIKNSFFAQNPRFGVSYSIKFANITIANCKNG